MRIVLDTNCLIQSIPRKSPYRKVWDSIISGKNILCVSNEIIEEYAEILQRLTDQRTANIVIRAIVENPHVEFFSPCYRFNLIQNDPDDNKFVDCAITASARFIVTNDTDYNVLFRTPFPHVDVIKLHEFANSFV